VLPSERVAAVLTDVTEVKQQCCRCWADALELLLKLDAGVPQTTRERLTERGGGRSGERGEGFEIKGLLKIHYELHFN
jgi:hypothetical protein